MVFEDCGVGFGGRDIAEPGLELRVRADGCFADRAGWGRRPRSRATSAVLATTRVPKAEMEGPTCGALATERWVERGAREGTRPACRQLRPRGRAKGELGSPDDPIRTSTAVAQRQLGPRLGGRKSSTMAAAVGDRCLPGQGHFPVVDPPCAGRGIPRSVRVNDSAVVAEGPLDQGPFEPFGVQK
jgi:hypothetical protein